MQSFYGDTEESTEDIPGRKKSRLKSLKSRLFGRSKRAGEEGSTKLSQSASDITAEKGLGSEEDLACSQGMMGSRALSHDSIFLADQVLTDTEPARVLSQENVHSKIKALQMKLQLQKMHLGPPPLLLPFKRSEDVERHYKDDSNSHSPPEIAEGDVTTQEIFSKTISQPLSGLLASIPKPAPLKSVSLPPSHPAPLSVSSNSSPSVVEPLLDFSSPAQLTTCLDTSAARHRMSVKPRNQRASTKRRLTATDSSSFLDALNNTDRTEPVREEEQQPDIWKEVTLEKEKEEAVIPITSQRLPSKSPEVALITSVATSKSSDLAFPQQDQALPAKVPSAIPQILRVKPHRPVDAMSSERPHSSFIPSELKNKRELADEIQVLSQDKRNTPNKAEMMEVSYDQPSTTFSSMVALRSSSVHQQVKGEAESARGIKRPAPESGSFRFSITAAKNRDVERPRSGIFVEAWEQTEDKHRVENKPYSGMKEKAEVRDLQPKGGSFTVGRPREDGAQHIGTVLPWDKRASVKKVELVTPSNTITTDTITTKGKDLESSQEVVEEAVEARFSITAAKNRDVERPRSGSFVGAREQTEDRHRVENKPYSSMKEKAEVRDLQPKGGSFTVGGPREDGAQHKSSVLPWDKRASMKKVELMMPSNTVTTDTGTTKEKDLESSQEVVEEAVVARIPITAAKNRDVERPQSGIFVEAWEQTEDKHRVENKPYSSMKEKAEVRDLQSKRGSFTVGRPREDGAQHKSSVLPWDKRASIKKVELVTLSNTVTTDTGTTKEKDLESSQEVVEEAVEARFPITAAKNQDVERPQSGIFVEAWEQTEDKHRVENKPYSSMKEKVEVRDLQPKGGSFTVGRPREDGAQNKSSVLPWDKRASIKKVELVTPSNTVSTDTGTNKEKDLESSQEVVEEAVEAREVEEDEGKTTFGIKLRSTSQSMRIRFDASSNHNTKPPVSEEQGDKQKRQETSNTPKKLSANISCTPSTSEDLKPTDPASSGSSLPAKHDPPLNLEVHIIPKDIQTTFSNPKEAEPALTAPQKPQPAPQTAPSEVSWMSLAMEKTRSIQQLFTSRLSRDFISAQPAARPQAQVQTTNQTETLTGAQTQTQTVKIQQSTTLLEPSGDAVKSEPDEGRQTVKPLLMAVQQKASVMSPVQSNTLREPQASKPTSEPPSHPDTTQPAQQSPSVQTDQQTTQSPSHSNVQTETQSQFAQGSAPQSIAQSYLSFYKQQPPWSSQGLQANNLLTSTTSSPTLDPTTSSASAPSSVSASGREETEATVQEKEGPLLSRTRPVWTGSVSERAVFLERRAERTTPSGTKGVEVKKAQTEVQTSGESKTAPLTTDTKPEGGQGVQPAESSPTKVPERPREDKGPQKNVQPSSSPSSSPPMPSALQSMSDSGQPSWMELAKRKSMAWSDKSLD